MGLCNSPNIFQEKMSVLMHDLEYVRAYIDDLLVITGQSYSDHLEKLGEVLVEEGQSLWIQDWHVSSMGGCMAAICSN
jgi:hypothetical protein